LWSRTKFNLVRILIRWYDDPATPLLLGTLRLLVAVLILHLLLLSPIERHHSHLDALSLLRCRQLQLQLLDIPPGLILLSETSLSRNGILRAIEGCDLLLHKVIDPGIVILHAEQGVGIVVADLY
jgi:hypothetical protein